MQVRCIKRQNILEGDVWGRLAVRDEFNLYAPCHPVRTLTPAIHVGRRGRRGF